MSITCPLSHSQNVTLIERISVQELLIVYHRYLGTEITSEFKPGLEFIDFYHCPDSDLRFFIPAVTGSQEFYEILQRTFDWYYLDEKNEYHYAKKFIKSPDKVLEIGSGKGAFAKFIDAKDYTGLEFSKKAQEIAAQNQVKVVTESIQTHAESHSEEYDIVCSFQVLEHVDEIDSFITASLKCLKPGGLLIYSVPSADSFMALARNNVLNMPPHHVSWWSDAALHYTATQYNLKLVDLEHETLDRIHQHYYLQVLALNFLGKRFGLPFRLIDCSFKYKLLSKLADQLARGLEFLFSEQRFLPWGHSVTAVYQKLE